MSYIHDPNIYLGDFPPLGPPGWAVPTEWWWNPAAGEYQKRPFQPLTTVGTTTTIPVMAKTEVIEYTHDFDGQGSSSIKHVYWNENTERLTVQFVGRGTYSYDGVELYLFEEFEAASSLGSFFSQTFTPRGDEKWPGAKHEERLVRFEQVETETDEPDHQPDGPNVDALKPTALTTGKGKTYNLTFAFAGRGTLPVRGKDAHEAIQTFMEHMSREGFTVTRVEATET